MTSGLHKYNHVSHYRIVIGWFPVNSVIPYHSLVAMYMQCRCNWCLLLNLNIKFEWHSSCHTRTPASFKYIFWYILSFSKKFFWSKTTNWWNNLPIILISSSVTKFSHDLYDYIHDFIILLCCLFLYTVCVVFNCLLLLIVCIVFNCYYAYGRLYPPHPNPVIYIPLVNPT